MAIKERSGIATGLNRGHVSHHFCLDIIVPERLPETTGKAL